MIQLLLLGSMGVLSSCTRVQDPAAGGHSAVWVPWPDESGQYRFQKISVPSVTSWAPLKGKAADIRGNANPVKGAQYFTSEEIYLDYSLDEDGAIIPLSPFSIEVAALYAHFEQFQRRDQDLGLPAPERPPKIFVGYRSGLMGNVFGQKLSSRFNNAFYDNRSDAFFVLPYSMKGLPLSVNGGVLSHEHFHSVFARLILHPLQDRANEAGVRLFDISGLTPHTHDSGAEIKQYFEAPKSTRATNTGAMSAAVESAAVESAAVGNVGLANAVTETAATEPQSEASHGDLETNGGSEFAEPIVGVSSEGRRSVGQFGGTFSRSNQESESTDRGQIEFINKALFVGLNEGLADVWGWFYGQDPCFMVPSYGAETGNRRCLTVNAETSLLLTPQSLAHKYYLYRLNQLNQGEATALSGKAEARTHRSGGVGTSSGTGTGTGSNDGNNKSELMGAAVDLGYEIGTNLAQMIYLRFEERGETKDKARQKEWQERMVSLLPHFFPDFERVLIFQKGREAYLPWNEIVDKILFGEGSPAVPFSQCSRWRKILPSLSSGGGMTAFSKHCPMEEGATDKVPRLPHREKRDSEPQQLEPQQLEEGHSEKTRSDETGSEQKGSEVKSSISNSLGEKLDRAEETSLSDASPLSTGDSVGDSVSINSRGGALLSNDSGAGSPLARKSLVVDDDLKN